MRALDESQAAVRAERHVMLAVGALSGTPGLELESELRTACDDPTDFGPKGRVQLSRRYRLTNVDVAAQEAFDRLHAHWLRSRYRLLDDGRRRTVQDMSSGEVLAAPLLWVEHNDDGFRLTLVGDVRGRLSLIVTSPCVWPGGMPPRR
jgi:hypothetical protein